MDQDLIRQFLNTKVNSMAVDKLKSGRVKTIYKYTKALPLTTNVLQGEIYQQNTNNIPGWHKLHNPANVVWRNFQLFRIFEDLCGLKE